MQWNKLPLCEDTVDLFMHVFFDEKNPDLIRALVQDASHFVTDQHKWLLLACRYNLESTVQLSCRTYDVVLYESEFSKCCQYASKHRNPRILLEILQHVVHKKKYEKYILSLSDTNPELVTIHAGHFITPSLLEKAVHQGNYSAVDHILSHDTYLPFDINPCFRTACKHQDIRLARRLIEYKLGEE